MANITQHINYPKVVYEQYRRWRIARIPLLAKLDISYMRALENNDKTLQREIIVQKNFLRNITQYDFSIHDTVEEAMAYWPTHILGPRPSEFDLPDPQ